MKLNAAQHLSNDWLAHSLIPDFAIEDVWRLPIKLEEQHSLKSVKKAFSSSLDSLEHKGISGLLFKLRYFLGEVFKWDEKPQTEKIEKGSLRERYSLQNQLSVEQLPDPGNGAFIPVYEHENETLSEIDNATVHAAIHFSRVQVCQNEEAINMTIYVKAKGTFGKLYMLLIKPFRLYIIYPAMLRMISKAWEDYHHQSNKQN